MGLKTSQRELEEKIKKKKDDENLIHALEKHMSMMSKELKKLNKNVEELKNKPAVVVSGSSGSETESQKLEQTNDKMFIPSVSTDGMKVKAGQVKKRSRKIDITDSVDELKELEK